MKISVSVVAVRAFRLIHGVHNIKGRVVYFFEMMRQPLHQLGEVAQIEILEVFG